MTLTPKHLSDTDLVQGIQVGMRNGRLMETILYNRYGYLIREGMHKHRLSQDECQRAYSDTMLAVISQVQRGEFAGRATLKTYLYRIFSNKCVDQVRTKRRNRTVRVEGSGVDALRLMVPDPVRAVIEQLIAQDEVDHLQGQLQRLNARSREIIWAWGEGYSDDEIAQRLGYRSAAVAKTIRLRSISQLRALYQQPKPP